MVSARKHVKIFITSILCVFQACASSQQQQGDELTDQGESGQNNMGEDDAAEGNGQENFATDNASQNSANSASMNSDTVDEVMAEPTTNDNLGLGNAGAAPGNIGTEAPPSNVPPAANPAAAANGAMMANTPAEGGAAVAPPPQASGQPIPPPIPGGRVRYVKEGGVQVMNAPNGQPVLTRSQGDHPISWEVNGWLKLNQGMYVPVDSLSTQGVGRPSSSQWTTPAKTSH